MVQQYDKTWPVERALWLAFAAKVRAEMAGGVGSQTDMTLIIPGERHVLTEEEKETLYRIFREVETKEEAAAASAVVEVRKHLEAEAAKGRMGDTQQTATEQSEPPKDKTKAKRPRKKPA